MNKKNIKIPANTTKKSHKKNLFQKFGKEHMLYVAYPIFSLCLVIQWFSDKSLLATAEQGLQLFNPIKTFAVYKHIWLEIGLGIANPFYTSRIPFYALLSFFYQLGLPNWIIQASVFFFLLTTGMLATVLVTSLLVKKENSIVPHIAAVLYLLNLFVMSQVLIRFIDALFFSWTFLPLFLYLWIRWVSTHKIRFLLFFIIASFIFSPAYSLLSTVLLLWIPACLYSSKEFFTKENKKNIFLPSVTGFVVWIVTNAWWLLPIWALRNNNYAEFGKSANNLNSLSEVSHFYPLSELLLLRQTYFFGDTGPWAVLYQNIHYLLPSYLLLVTVFFGIFISLKQKKHPYLLLFILIGFFLAKGTNQPFGRMFYELLFTYIPITQILRNPYEKVGLLFVLPYVIFSAIGISQIATYAKKYGGLVLIIFFVSILFLMRPMLRRDFFPTTYHVRVPDYYAQANTYISKVSEKRIFHLPYTKSSSGRYEWQYSGEEPSEFLFDSISLAKIGHIPSIDRYYLSLEEYITYEQFPKLLAVINTDTILMHNDYVSEVNKQDLKVESQGFLEKWHGLSEKKSVGKLDIYTINQYKRPGYVYSIETVTKVASISSGFAWLLKNETDISKQAFIVNGDVGSNVTIPKSAKNPEIAFSKVSPEEYTVQIKNAKNPYILVLSMNYNPNWIARTGSEYFAKHIKVNGYANAWVIEKKGNYTIAIKFKTW